MSRKQLAFGVISAVALSVVIFLLGVSVGRGVLATSAGTNAALDHGASADALNTGAPPPTSDASDRAGAPAGAANSIAMKVAEPPAPPPEMPAPKPDASAKVDPAPVQSAPPKPASTTPATAPATSPAHAAAKPDAQKPAPSTAAAHADCFVQVDVFRSKENADRLLTKLKASGYTAFELSPKANVYPYYRVQIGPFADRADADKTVSRLIKEGYKPSVTR